MEKIIIAKAVFTGASIQVSIADYGSGGSPESKPDVHMYYLSTSPDDLRDAIFGAVEGLLRKEV